MPEPLCDPLFRLEPFGEDHNDGDYDAWTTSIPHIRRTPGFVGWSWPPDEMTREENLQAARRHARHYAARAGFTYAVVEPASGEVIGCVYLYPCSDGVHQAEVRSWVRADRAELDKPLHDALVAWLADAWPFTGVLGHERLS